jgi:hypothetical protein
MYATTKPRIFRWGLKMEPDNLLGIIIIIKHIAFQIIHIQFEM